MTGSTAAALLAILLTTVTAQQCPESNGLYLDPVQCDKYIECIDGVPEEKLCPNGLLFNDKLTYNRYPCDYPPDVDCGTRTLQQPAIRSGSCPRLWGMFRVGETAADCGQFLNCVEGREYIFNCPEGLAWNRLTYRCDWPEEVDDCDIDAFLGYACPVERDLVQASLFGHERYPFPNDCKKYFLCIYRHDGGKRPRVSSCELGQVFNPDILSCDDQENVPGCENTWPAEEVDRVRALRLRDNERRVRRLQELRSRGLPGTNQ